MQGASTHRNRDPGPRVPKPWELPRSVRDEIARLAGQTMGRAANSGRTAPCDV